MGLHLPENTLYMVLTASFAQLLAKMPAYGSLSAHDVHCWFSPPSVQLGDVLMLIRDGMRGALRRRGANQPEPAVQRTILRRGVTCTTILCSMLSPGPSRLGAKRTCRWRNIWSRVEAIRCDMPMRPMIEEKYGIPRRRLNGLMSPWCYKRLEAFGGDISRFRVAKIQPSRLRQIAIAKTEPGDENNQDISSLVGKVDIRKLETFAQNDPDAYSYSGGLNRANQGILEFVEMFKAPIKMLHPLLTATQESNYIGTESIGAIPFTGVVLAHSNESEWQGFKANKNNEAFIDRICVIKVPYCLRITEEQKIYEKLISGSELTSAPCAPATLETLARFSVMSRLRKHEN